MLESDIDLATYTNLTQSFVNATFTGNLSGQGFTISGLAINSPSPAGIIGLFKTLNGSNIENVILEAFNITAGDIGNRYGALAAEVIGPNTRVKNIIVTNSTIDATSGGEAGALIGIVQGGSLELENITISAIVKGTRAIGGLIGYIDGDNVSYEVITGSNITILNSNTETNKGHIFGTIKINTVRPLIVHLTNINVINGDNLKLVNGTIGTGFTYLAGTDTAGTDFSDVSIIAPYPAE